MLGSLLQEQVVVDLVVVEVRERPVVVALISVPDIIVQSILVPVGDGLVDS